MGDFSHISIERNVGSNSNSYIKSKQAHYVWFGNRWFSIITIKLVVNGVMAGRGWVMVQSDTFIAPSLIEAMEGGDFYATTGVNPQRF